MIDLGGGAYFEILFPDRDVPGLETNMGSIVGRLVYGATSFMLTGDSPKAIEEYLDDQVDYQIALERLNDKNDPIISAKEMKKLLNAK